MAVHSDQPGIQSEHQRRQEGIRYFAIVDDQAAFGT
jgi:hypothetical protein